MFFPGVHQPTHARHLPRAFISINRIRNRRSPFPANEWILDSGAFTELLHHGGFRRAAADYAAEIRRWAGNGQLLAAVAQDWMCDPEILARTGLSVAEHQRRTVERYDELLAAGTAGVYVMPVLQGQTPADYLAHLAQYGERLDLGAWVGVGSIVRRSTNQSTVAAILRAIKTARPDLRLHGFGLKTVALQLAEVVDALHSADSMAWSFAARYEGRNANDWREAERFARRIESQPLQEALL